MGWTVRVSNSGEEEIFRTDPGAHPASCTMGTGSFPGVKSCRGMTLTPHPLLVPWSRKSRAIPLLPLWAVRPVQSLSACTRVQFTFYPPMKMEQTECSETLTHKIQTPGNFIFSPVTGLEWPRGFQVVKVPRFHDNGTGSW